MISVSEDYGSAAAATTTGGSEAFLPLTSHSLKESKDQIDAPL